MNLVRRKLGHVEKLMAAQQSIAAGSTQGVKVMAIRGVMSFEALKNSARCLFDHFPLLRCSINKIDGELYFVEHNDFHRIKIEERLCSGPDDWASFQADKAHESLDAAKAIWSLSILSDKPRTRYKIILTCHHAFLDESGGNLIARMLLDFSDRYIDGREAVIDPVGFPESIDTYLLPGLEDSKDRPVLPLLIPYVKNVEIAKRRTEYYYRLPSSESIQTLLAGVNNPELSINSVMCAALSMAACSVGIAQSPVAFKSAVSLREYAKSCGAKDDELGCYISVADTPLEITGKSLHDIAMRYQRDLLSYTFDRCLIKQEVPLSEIENGIGRLVNAEGFSGFGLSNLGSLDLGDGYNNFSVTENLSLTNRVSGNLAFALQVFTFDEQVHLVYAYVSPLIERKLIEELAYSFERHLIEYMGKPLSS